MDSEWRGSFQPIDALVLLALPVPFFFSSWLSYSPFGLFALPLTTDCARTSQPQQLSTYALTLFPYETEIDGRPVSVGALLPCHHQLCSSGIQFLAVVHCFTVSPSQIFGTPLAKSDSTACTHRITTRHTHACWCAGRQINFPQPSAHSRSRGCWEAQRDIFLNVCVRLLTSLGS